MVTVYGMSSSGNCYKVRLLLEQLRSPYHWIEVDTRSGETRSREFLARNANGRVPVLEFEPGQYLAESDAILFYLAEGTPFWPAGRRARAEVLQWLFFEQYSHEPYIAVARYICVMLPAGHERRQELPRLHERGAQALAVMEAHLRQRSCFVDEAYSTRPIPSLTSRCMPIPTRPARAASTLRPMPVSAPGSSACSRSPGSCRCHRSLRLERAGRQRVALVARWCGAEFLPQRLQIGA
jgi:glutathione S-transferase